MLSSGLAVHAGSSCVLAVHGGAYKVPDELLDKARIGIKAAARAGASILSEGGSALDAVTAAVCSMEDYPAFNCG